MEKYSEKYKDFLYENLEEKFKDKIGDDYNSLKRGILLLVDDSVENTEELVDVQNFINKSSENLDESPLVGFIDDGDIFNFYMKFQADIDEVCINNNWFNKTASEENVNSLYGYMISGSKFAVKQCLKILEKEMF